MAILHMLRSEIDTICCSYMVRSEGSLIALDGGFEQESENLYRTVRAYGGTVDAWFFTHAHDDHVFGFCKMMEDHPDVCVRRIVRNFPAVEKIRAYEPGSEMGLTARIDGIAATRGIELITAHRGDAYEFDGFTVRVINEMTDEFHENFLNDTSVVYRVEANGRRVLFPGDLGWTAGDDLLAKVPAEELKADYVQMAHHGQNGVNRAFYEAVDPDYCLWSTPSWLWDNMGPEGYDTGPYKTVIVRGWMSELGIKKHYIDRDAPLDIEL